MIVKQIEIAEEDRKSTKISVYTKIGEVFKYENVKEYCIGECGNSGILTITFNDHNVDYFRIGHLTRWSVVKEEENDQDN